jgi:hypothetical protein
MSDITEEEDKNHSQTGRQWHSCAVVDLFLLCAPSNIVLAVINIARGHHRLGSFLSRALTHVNSHGTKLSAPDLFGVRGSAPATYDLLDCAQLLRRTESIRQRRDSVDKALIPPTLFI